MNDECPILVTRAQHRPTPSARRCSALSLPQTHAGAVIFCGNIAYEDALLVIVVWRGARRCWKWLSRFGVPASCRPSIAPPVRGGAAVVCANIHYDVLLLIVVVWWDARSCCTLTTRSGAGCTSAIDVTARARWRRLRMRQRCLRCATTRCCRMAGRAQMSDNVDALWCALHFRPSMSPPVHGGAAAVCAKVAYDVPVLAVVE
jgi:hypothetical protein